MKSKIFDMSIKWQLMIICFLLVTGSILILGVASYNATKYETVSQVEDIIKTQVSQIRLRSDNLYNEIVITRESTETQAELVIETEAKSFLAFHDEFGNDEKRFFEAVKDIKIGETGYIYIMDYDGNMIYHSTNDALIGTNMMDTVDKRGFLFTRDQVNNGRNLVGDNIYWSEYSWRNSDLEDFREKIGGVLNIAEKEWIVVITTYYDELVDVDFEEKKTESFLDEIAEMVIGKTGYVYILNTDGDYVLSDNRQRDGENILYTLDEDGEYFIQEIIEKTENLYEGEIIQYYHWKNEGDSKVKMKLAACSPVEEFDWIICASAYQEDFFDGLNEVRSLTVIVGLAAIIVGLLISYLFSSYLTKIIKSLMIKVDQVAKGDLTVKVEDNQLNKNELGQMARSFSQMINNLKMIIENIIKNSSASASAAAQLSANAEEVNASMQQVASTVQEVAKGAQTTSQASEKAQDISKKTGDAAKTGSDSVTLVNEKMDMIKGSTKEDAEKIKSLGKKSLEIGNIVDTINSISEQTNLLALNAAIEAARAGEAGKGFAVVADEVRKLAEESGKSTGDITVLIKGIQDEIQSSVVSMENNAVQVEESVQAILEAMKSFEMIPNLVNEVNSTLENVSAVAEENAAGSEEVSSSVEQVTSSMQQVSSSAQNLNKSAEELKKLVSRFRLD